MVINMDAEIKIAMIVAMAENGVIGCDNQLPWHLPEDLRYFKATTMSKPIIMGRKTFDSIGRALPGRTNIVVSTQAELSLPEGVRLANTIEEASAIAKEVCLRDGVDEIMVIGGEKIYQLFMPQAQRLYLTKVFAEVDGDACFSGFNENEWKLLKEEKYQASDNNPYDYSFCLFERRENS